MIEDVFFPDCKKEKQNRVLLMCSRVEDIPSHALRIVCFYSCCRAGSANRLIVKGMDHSAAQLKTPSHPVLFGL